MPPKVDRFGTNFRRVNLTIASYVGVICPEMEVERHAPET